MICAVVPFFNEEKFLAECLTRTLPFVDLIIAVNDGSTDNSTRLIPSAEKIKLISFDKNIGKGFAVKNGLQECLNLNADLAVVLDSDLQHPPEEIPKFIAALEKYDIVIGNRLSNLSDMPIQRRLSNKISSFLLSIKSGTKIIDSQCGFRGFRVSSLQNILPESLGYEAESEMLIKAAQNNLRIGFVNIPTIYGDEKSKIKPFQLINRFLKVLLKKY